MDNLQIIESLVNEFFSPDCPDPQAIDTQLREWCENDDVSNVINYSLEFLATSSNEKILFFAATCLCNSIRKKWNYVTAELSNKLVSFLCDYIVNHLDNREATSYSFIQICLADIAVLLKDFPFQQAFSCFPIDIQTETFTFYFEEYCSAFYTIFFKRYSLPTIVIEYVNNILQNTPLSIQWFKLYHGFALGLKNFQPLMIYIPKLLEAVKIIPLCKIIIEHIKHVFIFDMTNGPDEYHFAIANLSIQLSNNLRMAIQQNPEDFDLADSLNLLWASVLNLEDENEYFFKSEFLPITLNLIEEFTNVESVLIESVKLSHDLELWPNLMYTAMRFCESFSPECPIANFAINVLEFILTGLDFGVELSDIIGNPAIGVLTNFYDASKDLFNNYFINPNLKSPSLLLIIGFLNSFIPDEITEFYCSNLQSFNAPPSVQVYFANQLITLDNKFVLKYEKFEPIFFNVFSQFFNEYPYECSYGVFNIIQNYPHLLDPNLIDQLSGWMSSVPYPYQEFLIPSIILLIEKVPNEKAAQIYTFIFQLIIHAFVESMQSQNKANLINFLNELHKMFSKILTTQSLNEDAYKLFVSFGQQIFSHISNGLQGIWMDPTYDIQFLLYHFVFDFLRLNFIPNQDVVAEWINGIFAVAPYDFHIYLVFLFKNYAQSMPNAIQFIKNLDSSKIDFMNSILRAIHDWDESYGNIVSPDDIFNKIFNEDKTQILSDREANAYKTLQANAYKVMASFVKNPKIPVDFKHFILQKALQGIVTFYRPPTKEQVELILCLGDVLGIEFIVTSIAHVLNLGDEEQRILANLFSLPQNDSMKKITEFITQIIPKTSC